MLRRRIGLLAWLVCVTGIWLYHPGQLAVMTMCATWLLTAVSLILGAYGAGRLELAVDAPETIRKSKKKSFQIILKNRGRLPVFRCTGQVTCYNSLTKELEEFQAEFSAAGGGDCSYVCKLNSPYCGCLHVTVSAVKSYDLLGVFAFRAAAPAGRDILLLPRMEETWADLMPGDSVTSAGSKPGEERFGVREYEEGDPVNLIHWKLSTKLDTTMLRETVRQDNLFGCLLLENSLSQAVYDRLAEEADRRMELLLGISRFYVNRNIRHVIVFYDFNREQFVRLPVGSPEDLYEARRQLMYAEFVCRGSDAAGRQFAQEDMEKQFLHTLYVTSGVTARSGEWMDEQWITPVYRDRK